MKMEIFPPQERLPHLYFGTVQHVYITRSALMIIFGGKRFRVIYVLQNESLVNRFAKTNLYSAEKRT